MHMTSQRSKKYLSKRKRFKEAMSAKSDGRPGYTIQVSFKTAWKLWGKAPY